MPPGASFLVQSGIYPPTARCCLVKEKQDCLFPFLDVNQDMGDSVTLLPPTHLYIQLRCMMALAAKLPG